MYKPIIIIAILISCRLGLALAAPAAANSPSGFFRTQVGALEVTALADGVGALPSARLHGDRARIAALLDDDGVDPVNMKRYRSTPIWLRLPATLFWSTPVPVATGASPTLAM